MTTNVTIAATSSFAGWFAAVVALALAGIAARGFARLRGTTLAAPAAWAVAAALVMAAVEAALAWQSEWEGTLGASLARYAAAAGTFCPLMAVLGAKRPQDRGWQWVVISLWIVLLVPAGQAWAARSGSHFHLATPWLFVLNCLVALGPLNYGMTGRTFAAWFVLMGQFVLISEYIFDDPPAAAASNRVAALVLLLLPAVHASLPRKRTRSEDGASPALPMLTERWLAFRDNWGSFWALRVMNRVNESAQLGNWPVRMAWGGFAPADGKTPIVIDDRLAAQIEQAMDSLLWRFERVEHKFQI